MIDKLIKTKKSRFGKSVSEPFYLSTYSINIDIFEAIIIVIFSDEAKKLEIEWNTEHSTKTKGAATRNFMNKNREVIISFYNKNPTFEDIAHESLHATQMILENIGYENNNIVDELPAYLTGYISQKIVDIFKNEKELKKKKSNRLSEAKKGVCKKSKSKKGT